MAEGLKSADKLAGLPKKDGVRPVSDADGDSSGAIWTVTPWNRDKNTSRVQIVFDTSAEESIATYQSFGWEAQTHEPFERPASLAELIALTEAAMSDLPGHPITEAIAQFTEARFGREYSELGALMTRFMILRSGNQIVDPVPHQALQ